MTSDQYHQPIHIPPFLSKIYIYIALTKTLIDLTLYVDNTDRLSACDALKLPILYSKTISFINTYRPKFLEDKIRRAYSKILLKQLTGEKPFTRRHEAEVYDD